MPDRSSSSLRVSVIIPTYNRANTVRRAIETVLRQDIADLEVIVVDDASTDGTERQIESLGDKRVRYIRHRTNRGAPSARNTGIGAARADLIAFQDSDDEWMPGKLAKQLRLFDEDGSNVNVVYSGFWRISRNSRAYIPESSVEQRNGNLLPQLLKGNFVSTQTMIVRKKCFDTSGLFDEHMPRFQDWELSIRLARHFSFNIVDEPLVSVHETVGNITSNNMARLSALELILKKHRDLFEEYPTIYRNHLYDLGNSKCREGMMAEGRVHFVQALRICPWYSGTWVGLIASYFGRRGYACLASIKKTVRTTITRRPV